MKSLNDAIVSLKRDKLTVIERFKESAPIIQ